MKIKRYENYITWPDNQGNFNTECNRASLETDLSLTIPTCDLTKVAIKGENNMLRIRKLTPCECMRLMGFTDDDYQALVNAGLSDSAIYHCAGDSIIVTCLISILSPLLSDNRLQHKQIIEKYVSEDILHENELSDN